MRIRKNFVAVFLVILSLSSIILLASGLSNLSLKPGTLFQVSTLNEIRILFNESGLLLNIFSIFIIVLPIIFLAVLVLGNSQKAQRQRKRFSPISAMIQILLLMSAIFLLKDRLELQNINFDSALSSVQSLTDLSFADSGTRENILPGWLAFLLSFFIFGGLFYFIWKIRLPYQNLNSTQDLISNKADEIIGELNTGLDFQDVITKCYYEMMEIVGRSNGLQRDKALTPREFEKRLLALGFPEEAVVQLTRLFEMVRYGTLKANKQQQAAAIACLRQIRSASKFK